MAPKGMSRRQTWMNLQNPGLSTEQAKSTKALPDWWHFSKLRTSWQPMLLMVVSSSGTLSFETGEVAHLFFGEDDGIGMRHWHAALACSSTTSHWHDDDDDDDIRR